MPVATPRWLMVSPLGSASDHMEALEALTALGGLPRRRRTFLAAKVAGYSYDEIAAQLEVTWRTVNRQLVRARMEVRGARARA